MDVFFELIKKGMLKRYNWLNNNKSIGYKMVLAGNSFDSLFKGDSEICQTWNECQQKEPGYNIAYCIRE